MSKRFVILCGIVLWSLMAAAQDTLRYQATVQAVAGYGDYAPFWLQTNRDGNISSQPFSATVSAGIYKPATTSWKQRWYDYSFGIELDGRADGEKVTGYMQQLFAHVRLHVFDITVGIRPVSYGNQDSLLSMGGILFSRNAHPMPRITIGIDHYTPVPFTFGYVELKGGLTHAWTMDNAVTQHWMLHHKFVGLRLGGDWLLNVNYELHHAAQWGGVSPLYGQLSTSWRDYWRVFAVRSGGESRSDQLNAQGNHLGSQMLGLTLKTHGWRVNTYWQNFFEDGPMKFIGCNTARADGLWGIAVEQTHWPFVNHILYEFLNTTDQSGPLHEKDGMILGGKDSYFRNSMYPNGWSYFWRTIGTPLITSPLYNTDGTTYTLNSRVRVHHVGVAGDIYGYRYRLLATYAQNYGNYVADEDHYSRRSTNTALLLEVSKHFQKLWGLDFGLSVGVDAGSQFGTQAGAMLSVRKTDIIIPLHRKGK